MNSVAAYLASATLFVGGLHTHHTVFTWTGAVMLACTMSIAIQKTP